MNLEWYANSRSNRLRPSDSSVISHTGNVSMLEGGRLSLIKEGGRRVLGTISIAGLCYFSVRYY